jgi:hypothetical protein
VVILSGELVGPTKPNSALLIFSSGRCDCTNHTCDYSSIGLDSAILRGKLCSRILNAVTCDDYTDAFTQTIVDDLVYKSVLLTCLQQFYVSLFWST